MKNLGRKLISIVVPVYNEEKVISEFYKKLLNLLANLEYAYEVIFIDDGSIDRTSETLQEIAVKDKNIKIIFFSRNFGHMIALSAGLDYASGDAVITMDSDLQHPPEVIPKLLEKWETGAEVVNTIRKGSRDIGLFKKVSARFFYWLMKRITKIDLRSNAADFRLLDRTVVNSIKEMREHFRFLRGLVSWVGYKQEFIEYRAESRPSGKTKYSLFKMIFFALDGITSFSSFPLRVAAYFGFIIAFFSFIYILDAVRQWLLHQTVRGWASVLVTILFMGGIQLIFLGIIGEYLARVYEETKNRPLYIVRKKIGFNN